MCNCAWPSVLDDSPAALFALDRYGAVDGHSRNFTRSSEATDAVEEGDAKQVKLSTACARRRGEEALKDVLADLGQTSGNADSVSCGRGVDASNRLVDERSKAHVHQRRGAQRKEQVLLHLQG